MRVLAIFYDGNETRARWANTEQPDSVNPEHFALLDEDVETETGTIRAIYPDCEKVEAVVMAGARFDTTPVELSDPEFLAVFIDGYPVDPGLTPGDGTGSDEGDEEASTD